MQLDDLVEDCELVDPVEAKREEWLKKRLGKITCSRFPDLMSSGRSKDEVFSQTGKAYLRRIVAERLGSWYSVSAKAMDWGNDNENKAICAYAARNTCFVDDRPFQFFDYSEDIGGTPDGLVGEDGCVEVKCPFDPAVHINTILTKQVPKDYEWQVIGHLLVTKRKWCDFISFDPRIEGRNGLFVVRVEREEPRIGELAKRLELAVAEIKEMMYRIEQFFDVPF
jgi:hypothetical protein